MISSPFLLGATITYHLQSSSDPIAKGLHRDIYVDNLITGVDPVDGAKSLFVGAKGLFEAASMNLREWAYNSKEFIEHIPESDKAVKPHQKVLGVSWNVLHDTLSIPVSYKSDSHESKVATTKREILQQVSSIFDPLGFFSPITLKAKLFMKK